MERGDFIKQSAKLTGIGLIASQIPGCLKYNDLFYLGLYNGTTWSNHQLVVAKSSSGLGLDTNYVDNPSVIKDGSTFKMWYGGDNGTRRILYCESSDGKNWSNFKLSINTNNLSGFDNISTTDAIVIKEGSTYKMWYAGNALQIIYCESSNGVNWNNYQVVLNIGASGLGWDSASCYGSTVIKEDSTYKMWYTGNGIQILYCESQNGINWYNFRLAVGSGAQGTYDTNASSSCTVIKDGSMYKMWYAGKDAINTTRILYCISSDGITWKNHQLAVGINNIGTGIDSLHSSAPSVINDYGIAKMWYRAQGASWQILYAESK